MKINYVIMGSNMDPLYLDFWPIISKVWKEKFNIIPVLGLITNYDSDFIEDEYGIVKNFKVIEGIDSGLQSQLIRLFLTTQLAGNLLISDIDMLPLSKQYFINNVQSFDEMNMYVMSADNEECLSNKEYPMCYILANNKTFRDCLNIESNWSEFINRINNLKKGWATDQQFIFENINEYNSNNSGKVALLKRGWEHGRALKRIDRIFWHYDPQAVVQDYYIDSHLLRPYQQYKTEIDKLINLLY